MKCCDVVSDCQRGAGGGPLLTWEVVQPSNFTIFAAAPIRSAMPSASQCLLLVSGICSALAKLVHQQPARNDAVEAQSMHIRGPRFGDVVVKQCCEIDFQVHVVQHASPMRDIGTFATQVHDTSTTLAGLVRMDVVLHYVLYPHPNDVMALSRLVAQLPTVHDCLQQVLHSPHHSPACAQLHQWHADANRAEALPPLDVSLGMLKDLKPFESARLTLSASGWRACLIATQVTAHDSNGRPTISNSTAFVLAPIADVAPDHVISLPQMHPPPPAAATYGLTSRAIAILTYSDDYARSALVVATTMWRAAAAANQREENVVLLIGCKPPQHGHVYSQDVIDMHMHLLHVNGTLAINVHLSTALQHCVPMLSPDTMRQLRAFQLMHVHAHIEFALVPWLSYHAGVPVIGLDEGVWMKVHAWALQPLYGCVVMLDADMIVMRPLEELFRVGVCGAKSPTVAGVWDQSSRSGSMDMAFHVGILVLQPRPAVWQRMMSHLHQHNLFQVVETSFINWFFASDRILLVGPLLCLADSIPDGYRHDACFTVDFSSCGPARFKPWHAGNPPTEKGQYCRNYPTASYLQLVSQWRQEMHVIMRNISEVLQPRNTGWIEARAPSVVKFT